MSYFKLIISILFILSIDSCNNQPKKNIDTNTISINEPSDTGVGKIEGSFGGCGFNITTGATSLEIYSPRQRELNQISSILKFTGLSPNFKIFRANIQNAVATIIGDKRYILYDSQLLDYTDQKSNNYWSSMSILAHEIGHHLSGHTITKTGSNPHDELEADKYSGFILYKLGATLEQSTAAMRALGSETASLTHPAKSDRLRAITIGWNEANQTRFKSAIPPPPNDDPFRFHTYTYNMLISQENLDDPLSIHDKSDYENYDFFYGVITEVSVTGGKVDDFKVYIHKTGKNWNGNQKNLDGEILTISLDNYVNAPDICMACIENLSSLLVPGRRLKFSFVNGLEGGTGEHEYSRLTYAEGLDGKAF